MIPFLPGRRHEDAGARTHLRALDLAASRLSEPLAPEEDAWLEGHLAACEMCATIADEYEADARLLRAMPFPEAPRDLWARTAAAIEAESGPSKGRRPFALGSVVPPLIPLGALSGALVVGVVVVASLLSSPTVPPVTPTSQPLPSTALASLPPDATPIAVAAAEVGWVTQREDGTYTLAFAPVRKVCSADIKPDCPPLQTASPVALTIRATPGAIVGAPDAKQLVVVESKTRTTGGSLYVVDIPAASPSSAPSPAASSSAATASPTPSPSAAPSSALSPSLSPAPMLAIASDVVVVGETGAYSSDGQWFAFSARPADDSQGPDIYVWARGDAAAHAVTFDHSSVFSGWTGDHIIGSRAVRADATATASGSPDPGASASVPGSSPSVPGSSASTSPGPVSPSAPLPTPVPSSPVTSQAPSPSGSATPSASAGASAAPVIATPVSFVLDPATGASATIPADGMWRPVVDASGTYAAYWQGTLRLADDGVDWMPDAGHLVVARWAGAGIEPVVEPTPSASPSPSPDGAPSASPDPSPSLAASTQPSASVAPSSSAAPSGSPSDGPTALPSASPPLGTLPVALTDGPVRDWDIRWDETGTRLGVWVADPLDPTVGDLALHTLDRETDTLDPQGALLEGQQALPGFSIGAGRLAWATPPGQGGEGSKVEVLAWSGESAGRIESQPGQGLGPVVVIR